MAMEGSCSCGQIKITIPSGMKVGVCHCIDCRKATGSTNGASFNVPRRDFKLTGTPKVYAKTGNSGSEIRRYFCGHCGSPVYVETDSDLVDGKATDDTPVYVKIGLFPVGSIPRPSAYLFVRDMEEWEKPVEGAEAHETQ